MVESAFPELQARTQEMKLELNMVQISPMKPEKAEQIPAESVPENPQDDVDNATSTLTSEQPEESVSSEIKSEETPASSQSEL